MQTILFLVAIGIFLIIPPSYSQSTSTEQTKVLFDQSYPELELHQLLFLAKPSTQKLKTQKRLLSDSLQSCWIITKEGQEYKTTCRYFILEDQIEFYIDDKRYILQANQIQAVKIDDKIFIAKPYQFEGSIFYGYFQVLAEGRYNLLKKYTTAVRKNNSHPFELIEEYYYQKTKDKFPTKFELKKKHLASCFSTEGQKWKSYYKKSKPNLKEEINLIKIFQHFNQSTVDSDR